MTAFDVGVLPRAIFELVLIRESSWKNGRAEHTISKVRVTIPRSVFLKAPIRQISVTICISSVFKNNFPFVEFSLFFEIVIILDNAA